MHGGARPNAGRKKGSVTKATVYRQEMLARAAAEGLSPLEFMLDVLRDETKTFEERFEAAKAAAPAAKAVADALPAADDETKYYLLKALANFEEHAVVAVPQLIVALNSKDARHRYYAAKTLGKVGKEAKSALSALQRVSRDSDENVRRAATDALDDIAS